MNDSSPSSEGLLAEAHKAGQEYAPTDHHQKSHGQPDGLLHESRAAGLEGHGREEQEAAVKLPTETFEEFIIRSRREQQSSDDDGPARGRSLPDEEKEDQGRGR